MTSKHEPADAHGTPLLVGAALALLATGVGSVAVWLLLKEVRGHVTLRPEVARWYQATPIEVNEVEAASFGLPTEAELGKTAARSRQQSFGWVDRAREIVHVPTDFAAEVYLRECEERMP